MKDAALKLALEALKEHEGNYMMGKDGVVRHVKAIDACEQALAAPVQEPVAWQHRTPICDLQGETLGYSDWKDGKGLDWWPRRAFYTTPPAAQPAPCTWTKSPDPHMPDTYSATCGAMWTFTDNGPTDNNMNFCPKCGSKVAEGGAA